MLKIKMEKLKLFYKDYENGFLMIKNKTVTIFLF